MKLYSLRIRKVNLTILYVYFNKANPIYVHVFFSIPFWSESPQLHTLLFYLKSYPFSLLFCHSQSHFHFYSHMGKCMTSFKRLLAIFIRNADSSSLLFLAHLKGLWSLCFVLLIKVSSKWIGSLVCFSPQSVIKSKGGARFDWDHRNQSNQCVDAKIAPSFFFYDGVDHQI